jgi:hypothetical protein
MLDEHVQVHRRVKYLARAIKAIIQWSMLLLAKCQRLVRQALHEWRWRRVVEERVRWVPQLAAFG